MPEGQTERVAAPANLPFRAPRDRFFGLAKFHRLKAKGYYPQKAKRKSKGVIRGVKISDKLKF